MNILFIHKTFPGQFKHLACEYAKNPNNKVVFISDDRGNEAIKGVERLVYTYVPSISAENCHPHLQNFVDATENAQKAANIALKLKSRGFIPDIVIGFSCWGDSMYIKDIFPETPFLSYYEWYYNSDSEDIQFSGIQLRQDDREHIRCKNAKLLIDLYSSDAGMSPTNFQKSQFPKEYQSKIKVIHDGIDTEFFKPDNNVKFLVKEKGLELSIEDEVITYATRGMEALRGFPQFMEAIEKVLKDRPNAQVVIAGEDIVVYGQPLAKGTYKEFMLKKLNLDLSRVHFVGKLQYSEYLKLLQISSVHVYLTYPYVLSWSLLEAMSAGCCLVGSSTSSMLEVCEDGYNSILVDFFDAQALAQKIEYALDNKDEMQVLRKNARNSVVENYDYKKMLKMQMDYVESLINK